MIRPPARLAAALAAAAVLTGCASAKAARARSDYLKSELEPFVYRKPLADVWPAVLRLLHDKGYPLVGNDAVAVGQSENWLTNFLSPGSETRSGSAEGSAGTGFLPNLMSRSTKGEDTWRYLKTGLSKDYRMFRVDGVADGDGSRVVFTAYQGKPGETGVFISDTARRDFPMELELVRRVDPAAAARIESGMP
jgi:hypothetical protein